MLDIKALFTKVLNCCYIKGTSGNWTYKKYGDGTIEAWYRTGNITITADNSWWGWYYHNYTSTIPYPSSLFTNLDNIQMQCRTGDGLWYVQPQNIGSYIPFYAITSRQNHTATAEIYVYLIGRWK